MQAGKMSINLDILNAKIHGSKMQTMLDVLNAKIHGDHSLSHHSMLIVADRVVYSRSAVSWNTSTVISRLILHLV